MNPRKGLQAVLGIIGLAALMAYILACRPSWSPDGSKVVFPYYDPGAKQHGVALYDRAAGTVRPVFSFSDLKPWDVSSAKEKEEAWQRSGIVAQWARDGRRVIVSWKDDEWHVLVLPVDSRAASRSFGLPIDPGEGAFVVPLPEVEGNLFLACDSHIARLNLDTGETQFRGADFDGLLAMQGNHVFYCRTVKTDKAKPDTPQAVEQKKEEPKPEGPGPAQPEENESAMECGEVNREDLTFKPFFVLDKAARASHGLDAVGGFLAPEPRGPRMAMLGADKDEQAYIVLLNNLGIERVLKPQITSEKYELGNLEWSLSGKKIYATFVMSTDQKDIFQFGIAEISLADAGTRLIPIARLSDTDLNAVQIALSPDGSTIATSTADLGKSVEMKDRALYLVDLRDPKRKVTKILMPGSVKKPAPAAKAKK